MGTILCLRHSRFAAADHLYPERVAKSPYWLVGGRGKMMSFPLFTFDGWG